MLIDSLGYIYPGIMGEVPGSSGIQWRRGWGAGGHAPQLRYFKGRQKSEKGARLLLNIIRDLGRENHITLH